MQAQGLRLAEAERHFFREARKKCCCSLELPVQWSIRIRINFVSVWTLKSACSIQFRIP